MNYTKRQLILNLLALSSKPLTAENISVALKEDYHNIRVTLSILKNQGRVNYVPSLDYWSIK